MVLFLLNKIFFVVGILDLDQFGLIVQSLPLEKGFDGRCLCIVIWNHIINIDKEFLYMMI